MRGMLGPFVAGVVARVVVVAVLPLPWAAPAALASGAAGTGAAPNEPAQMTLGDAVAVLAEEQALGEQGALLLDRFGRADVATYAQGVMLYAEAQGAFNGFIEKLKLELTGGSTPGASTAYRQALDRAAGKRQAFIDFVRTAVIAKRPEHEKGGLLSVGKEAGALISALTDSGVKIWEAYRKAGDAQRDAIRAELDAQRWPSFERATGG